MPRPTPAQLAYGSATVVLSTLAMLLLSQARSGVGVVVIAVAALALGLLVALTAPVARAARAVRTGRTAAVAAGSVAARPASSRVPVRHGAPGGAGARTARIPEVSLRR